MTPYYASQSIQIKNVMIYHQFIDEIGEAILLAHEDRKIPSCGIKRGLNLIDATAGHGEVTKLSDLRVLSPRLRP